MKSAKWVALLSLGLGSTLVQGYPLDGDDSGIRRLQGQRALQELKGAPKLHPGALLSVNDIRLHLREKLDWNLDAADRDPDLQQALEAVFKARDPSYGVVVVDYTDPGAIRWAAVREERPQMPGSVGKILCMTALFDGLRRAFPDDIEARRRLLREHWVEATDWVVSDSHKVPR
jgi:hypothetical protein